MTRGSLYIIHLFLICLLLFTARNLQANDTELLDKKVYLNKNRGTIYELLQQVSEQSGYSFIYDSQLINNDLVVKINKGEYSIRNAIYAIVNNSKLEVKLIGNHILLYLPKQEKGNQSLSSSKDTARKRYCQVEGALYDRITQEPIPFGLVSLNSTNIGTITNQEGMFKLLIPDSLRHGTIKFSHLGYRTQEFETSFLAQQNLTFTLNPKFIPLQEVVIRTVNPTQVLKKMISNRSQNYHHDPINITTFYRELIEYKKKSISATEGVLEIYKTSHLKPTVGAQVRLIKMRRIASEQKQDSILVKMKAGIETCLALDVVTYLPDFLLLDEINTPYVYLHTDITSIDGKDVYVISFQQKDHIKEPLYKGQLFIATDSYALIEADFEVNTNHVKNLTDIYILRKPKGYKFTLQHVAYKISYKPTSNGSYCLNYVRGDLHFKVGKKKSIFNSPLNVSFEMLTSNIQTENVKTFPRNERVHTYKVFSEIKHSYDVDFWENFNTILPENKLLEFLMKHSSSVSEETSSNSL